MRADPGNLPCAQWVNIPKGLDLCSASCIFISLKAASQLIPFSLPFHQCRNWGRDKQTNRFAKSISVAKQDSKMCVLPHAATQSCSEGRGGCGWERLVSRAADTQAFLCLPVQHGVFDGLLDGVIIPLLPVQQAWGSGSVRVKRCRLVWLAAPFLYCRHRNIQELKRQNSFEIWLSFISTLKTI